MKSKLWILFQIYLMVAVNGSKLLKVPRIYNALITSDEELVPSQAYPAVAPVLRPSPPLYLTHEFPIEKAEPVSPIPVPTISEEPEDISWDKFKNNKPSDPNIPDVPPPPLPVTIRQGKL
ncbi:uncharacterized protein [Halyomorpha halys]|uniref:uncharacterized protein n=1 Tax=Halyomorpha halys TaxID=286706 RepID=UPI0006D5264D|nr:uncharacterized protein LOC106681424 [Halyomorpha halys]